MDAVDILKVCLRRWYVMLPILLGAGGVSYQLVQAQEPSYTAAASYGLVQPALAPGSETEAEANPLGAGGNALVGAALEAQLNARETQARLGGEETRGWGPGEAENDRSYIVQIPQFETTYEVRAWGEDEDEVRDVVNRVIEASPGIADDLQVRAGVSPPQRFHPFVLAATQVEVLPSTSGLKLVVAVMGVGVLMGAAWSVVVDRALRMRRSSRPDVRLDARPADLPASPAPPTSTRAPSLERTSAKPPDANAGKPPGRPPGKGTGNPPANPPARVTGGASGRNGRSPGRLGTSTSRR